MTTADRVFPVAEKERRQQFFIVSENSWQSCSVLHVHCLIFDA